MEMLVIADDLTGANETGAQFATLGLQTVVTARWPAELCGCGEVAVLVINTESRHLPPAQAAARVSEAVRLGCGRGVARFYKKSDSTLRGNVGAELEAMMRATDTDVLPFVPAHPQAGRTTVDGRHFVEGVPLHETPFATDPREPVSSSKLTDVLRRQTHVLVCVLDPTASRLPDRRCICAFNAETAADLDTICDLLERWDMLDCCAGAAGLAQRVAGRLSAPRSPAIMSQLTAPMLTVSGSLKETALQQVRWGLSIGMASVRVGPEVVFARDSEVAAARSTIGPLLGHLRAGRHAILHTALEQNELVAYSRRARALAVADPSHAVARALACIAAAAVDRCKELGTVVVFGGQTASAVLHALDLSMLRPLCEPWPGVVVCQMPMPDSGPGIVTKCGGFGPPDVLEQLVRICERSDGTNG